MTQLPYGIINNKPPFTRKSEGLFGLPLGCTSSTEVVVFLIFNLCQERKRKRKSISSHLPMTRMNAVSWASDQKTFPPSSDGCILKVKICPPKLMICILPFDNLTTLLTWNFIMVCMQISSGWRMLQQLTSLFFPHHNFIVGEVGGGGSKVVDYIMWGVVKGPFYIRSYTILGSPKVLVSTYLQISKRDS